MKIEPSNFSEKQTIKMDVFEFYKKVYNFVLKHYKHYNVWKKSKKLLS